MANDNTAKLSQFGGIGSDSVGIAATGSGLVVANTNAAQTSGGLDPYGVLASTASNHANIRRITIPRSYNTLDLFFAWTGGTPASPVVRVYGLRHIGNSAAEGRQLNADVAGLPTLPNYGPASSATANSTTDLTYAVPLDDPSADPTVTPDRTLVTLPSTAVLTSTIGGVTLNMGARRSVYLAGCTEVLVHVVTAGSGTNACILARASS